MTGSFFLKMCLRFGYSKNKIRRVTFTSESLHYRTILVTDSLVVTDLVKAILSISIDNNENFMARLSHFSFLSNWYSQLC